MFLNGYFLAVFALLQARFKCTILWCIAQFGVSLIEEVRCKSDWLAGSLVSWLVGCAHCWQRYRLSKLLTHKHNEPPVLLPSQTNLKPSATVVLLRVGMPDELRRLKCWWKTKKTLLRKMSTHSNILSLSCRVTYPELISSSDMKCLCRHHP